MLMCCQIFSMLRRLHMNLGSTNIPQMTRTSFFPSLVTISPFRLPSLMHHNSLLSPTFTVLSHFLMLQRPLLLLFICNNAPELQMIKLSFILRYNYATLLMTQRIMSTNLFSFSFSLSFPFFHLISF